MLVSFIVRTTGRATLERSLECIRGQSHRPIEIVLVDAAGNGAHAAQSRDGVTTRIVTGKPLARAAAANAGLDGATGEWLAFLDDDDLLRPDHVAGLLAALAREPRARAACCQTDLVDANLVSVRRMGGPFDRFALFRSNYLAIHAVLFARSLVAEGCRFDETLEQFEDWDFWLQACLKTGFAYAPVASALYPAEAGASGAGSGANLDRERLLANRERLMAKWGAAQAALVQKARHAEERAAALAKSGRAADAAKWGERARQLRYGDPTV